MKIIQKKKKFCVLQKKNSVIWTKPHTRSLAKQFGRTKSLVSHYQEAPRPWVHPKKAVNFGVNSQPVIDNYERLLLTLIGTIHLRRRQIFTIFDPYPPYPLWPFLGIFVQN